MKKVLLVNLKPKHKVVHPLDNSFMDSVGSNSGNAVFEYSVESFLKKDFYEVYNIPLIQFFKVLSKVEFNQEIDRINETYKCIIISSANVINNSFGASDLQNRLNVIKKLRIPVYDIGIGAQNSDFKVEFLTKEASNIVTDYVSAILNTGGGLGLRGHFSLDVLQKLGFKDNHIVATGCPSLYVKGRHLSVKKKEVDEGNFTVVFNGFRVWNDVGFRKYFDKYKNSIFVCQDEFYRLLYKPNDLTWKEAQYLGDRSEFFMKMHVEKRVKLYPDFLNWYNDIKQNNYHFSFGCRIHGNILSILAGVPALVDSFDSRTREMSEFFEIPNKTSKKGFPDPFSMFYNLDYSTFNKNYPAKYDNFIAFFKTLGLLDYINQDGTDIDNETYYKIEEPVNRVFKYEYNK